MLKFGVSKLHTLACGASLTKSSVRPPTRVDPCRRNPEDNVTFTQAQLRGLSFASAARYTLACEIMREHRVRVSDNGPDFLQQLRRRGGCVTSSHRPATPSPVNLISSVRVFAGGQHGAAHPFSDEDASIETLSHCSSFSDSASLADDGGSLAKLHVCSGLCLNT